MMPGMGAAAMASPIDADDRDAPGSDAGDDAPRRRTRSIRAGRTVPAARSGDDGDGQGSEARAERRGSRGNGAEPDAARQDARHDEHGGIDHAVLPPALGRGPAPAADTPAADGGDDAAAASVATPRPRRTRRAASPPAEAAGADAA